MKLRYLVLPAILPLAGLLFAETPASAPAQIAKTANFPADYKGTPYKGVAQEIPGRVEMENFDEGGFKVAYQTEHHEGDASGKKYRPGPNPEICVTNNPLGPDTLDGKRYPAEGESYFIGHAKKNDECKYTVNVKKAGVYNISMTASCEKKGMKFDIFFNDVKKVDYTTETEGSNGYHTWKSYPNFASVKLEAGLQVIKFHLNQEHLNYDFLEFTFDEKATAEAAK